MKEESFTYILFLTVREKHCQPYDVFQNKGKIQVKNIFVLVLVIFGADVLISGKCRVIVLKLILYLQPKMRYCGEQIVMKQMKSSSLLREYYRTP